MSAVQSWALSRMTQLDSVGPSASIIILNYNGLRFAEQCVRSVLDSDYSNFEVVLVDNGSTDGSYEVLRQLFAAHPRVGIVRNARNLGFAEGNNVGYSRSKGNIVVFLNVDTTVERTWLAELVRVLTAGDRVGGAQSGLTTHAMDWLGLVYMSAYKLLPPDSDQMQEPFYPHGDSMAFKRSVLEEAALEGCPFDRDYFLYFEDNDLGWRVRLRGYSIVSVPSSVVHHYGGGSASYVPGYIRTFSYGKNRFMTLIKNYGLRNLVRFLPLAMLLEFWYTLLTFPRMPRKSLAKLEAILWCLTNFQRIWRKRVQVQSRIRRVPDSEIVRRMLRPNFLALRMASVNQSWQDVWI
jgi:GT2 family glycosyltransferase